MTLLQMNIENLLVPLLKGLNHIFVETEVQQRGSTFKVLHSTLK